MGEFLKQRAEEFLEEAEELLKKKRYALSAFNFEQAVELLLKYYLYLKAGNFPQTHSLRQLFFEVGKNYKQEKRMKKFIDSNISVISDLEKSYIISRYFSVEFVGSQVRQMQKIVREILAILNKL